MRGVIKFFFLSCSFISLAYSQMTGTLSTSLSDRSGVPHATATIDPRVFVLSKDFLITNVPTTREYTFNITKALASPDGYEREVIAINGMFPGPLIEANTGDTIIVHVNNGLDEGQGLLFYSAWRLIVHSVDEPIQRGRDYDEDRVVFVTDWIPQGYRGGRTNCTATGSPSCTNPPFPEIPVPVNSRIRLRFISGSSHVFFRMSLDNHSLEVVETDGTGVYGPMIHEVSLSSGERYSAIINTFDGKEGDAFWLRATSALGCLKNGFHQVGLAIQGQMFHVLGLTKLILLHLGEVNIILNNLDANIPHPYHLHGNEIQLLARGTGSLSVDDLPHISLDLDNPLRKDTFWMEGGTWLAVVVVQPKEIEQIRWSQPWLDVTLPCYGESRKGILVHSSLVPDVFPLSDSGLRQLNVGTSIHHSTLLISKPYTTIGYEKQVNS
ncbi:hypothetical protein I352_04221 [Cryptococcus deuterogattii MMRL2647]|nr:hypothetical protein I352_04221 [Cryptococcus deuterogattii MMRL2647]